MVIENKVIGYAKILSQVPGFFDDVGVKKEEIDDDIRNNALLKDKKIKKSRPSLKIYYGIVLLVCMAINLISVSDSRAAMSHNHNHNHGQQ